MSNGLPLEVLGLLSPILSWVESGDRHGMAAAGQRNKFSINDRIQDWLVKELPTYSYDTLDEIHEAAFASPEAGTNVAASDHFPLTHMLRKLSLHYLEWRGNKLCIKDGRMVELHELAMRFPVQHLIRYRYVDAAVRGYIPMERALDLPVLMNQLDTSYQGMCTLVSRGLSEGHLHLGGVIGVEETWADQLLGWLSPGNTNRGHAANDCFILLGRIAVRLLAMGLLYRHALPYGDAGEAAQEAIPLHLIRRLDDMYLNRNLLTDPRARGLLLRQWNKAFTREFQPGKDQKKIAEEQEKINKDRKKIDEEQREVNKRKKKIPKEQEEVDKAQEKINEAQKRLDEEKEKVDKKLGKVPWRQLPQFHWLLELANPGMTRVWFRDRAPAHKKNKNRHPGGVRERILLLNRFNLRVQELLVGKGRRNPREKDGESREQSFAQQVEEFVNRVFTRYLIYHTHYWKQATQAGKTTGLRRFQVFYDAPERDLKEKNSGEVAGLTLDRLSKATSLRQLEGRLTPPSNGHSKYIPWLLAFAQQVKKRSLDKFGIVVHFKKASHGSSTREAGENLRKKYGLRDREKKQAPIRQYFLRYGDIRRETRSDAFKLFRLLSSPDPVVPFIVGIDAASLELTTPPEVFAPAFRFLKEYPIDIRKCGTSRAYSERHDYVARLVNNRLLGMTYHVGEDFRHLLSGLRAIHEVVEYFEPQPGDRLGHAIALGLDPEVWSKQMGYHAVVPKQEWLDTLVWIHSFLGAGNDLVGELSIEERIQYFSKTIYAKTKLVPERYIDLYCIPITLYDSWRLRQLDPYSIGNSNPLGVTPGDGNLEHTQDNVPPDDIKPGKQLFSIPYRGDSPWQRRWLDVQKKILKKLKKKVGSDGAYLLTNLYWFCPRVAEEGRKPVTIDMIGKKKLWLQLCRQVQEKLRGIVRDRHLVVEVNPSSNRVIGPMASMQDHPVFRLTDDKDGRLGQEGRVTINTDDPGVFATSLSHEFFLLGEVLLGRGYPEEEVMRWLEWLRQKGGDYSFLRTLPGGKDKRVLDILSYLEKRYRPLARRVKGEFRRYIPPESPIKGKAPSGEEFKRLKNRIKELENEEEMKRLQTRLEELEKKLENLGK